MSHPCELLNGCIGGGSFILEDSPPFLMGTKMEEITANVSWIAIIVGAIVSFLVGWLWYSEKLFGTKWAEGSKVELGNASEMPISAMVTQVLGLFVVAWVVAVLAEKQMLWTTILMVIGYGLLQYSGNSFTQKTSYAKMVDTGYWVVAVVIMIIVQMFL